MRSVPAPEWKSVTLARFRDRVGFHISLLLAGLGVLVLFWPFRYVLLFAVMMVVVTYPIFLKILDRVGGSRTIAAGITTFGLLALLVTPLVLVSSKAVQQAPRAVRELEVLLNEPGRIQNMEKQVDTALAGAPKVVRDSVPKDLAKTARTATTEFLNDTLTGFTVAVPSIVRGILKLAIQLAIFLFAVVSLYRDGPRLVRFLLVVWPIDDVYERRLFKVFARTTHNVIIASAGAAFLQGAVAALGYKIAGVDQVIFLGVLTGLGAFVPLVGTTIVWIPIAIAVYAQSGAGWALFVVAWSVVITGGIDNVVKPLLVRGDSGTHPLLVFLAVFGGLAWMGLPGLLVGPVVVALFLALCEIYEEDFAVGPAAVTPPARSRVPDTAAPA
jgi:predicted PurR-regulated permease PerM